MLILDVVVGLIIIGALCIGGGIAYKFYLTGRQNDPKYLKSKLEDRGEFNAEVFEVEQMLRCIVCDGDISPHADLFTHGAWWHKRCLMKDI